LLTANDKNGVLPSVSVIVPAFNRSALLLEALQSVMSQSFSDWELIVIDDGSTDDTKQVVRNFQTQVTQHVRYLFQQNQGPGAARQLGIETARGEYIAFLDSDDPWLAHHLLDSVVALNDNPDLDWVVSPARVVNRLSGEVIHENSFFPYGRLIAKLNIQTRKSGRISIITQRDFVEHVIKLGFPGGLQTSVLRRHAIQGIRMRPYRAFEDQVFQIEAVLKGVRVAFFEEPHITYQVHDQNVSLANQVSQTSTKRVAVLNQGVEIFRELLSSSTLSRRQERLVKQRLAKILFWDLGYVTFWEVGEKAKAFEFFRQGLSYEATDWRKWRTLLKSYLSLVPRIFNKSALGCSK
jgi:glycosyltransferase involved in cell wall biosynthesis